MIAGLGSLVFSTCDVAGGESSLHHGYAGNEHRGTAGTDMAKSSYRPTFPPFPHYDRKNQVPRDLQEGGCFTAVRCKPAFFARYQLYHTLCNYFLYRLDEGNQMCGDRSRW